MQQHLLDHNLARVLHAQRHHGEAIANEDNIHTGGIGDVCRREVVRRDDGDGLVPLVHSPQRAERDLLPVTGAMRPQR